MQHTKDPIQQRILESAEAVFARQGFARATMREIATRSGVSTSNIYNYFSSKDEIFCTLVRPAARNLHQILERHHGKHGADILNMYREEYIAQETEAYISLILARRSQLHLLLFRAEGSSLARFREEFTDKSTRLVQDYLRTMQQKHPQLSLCFTSFSIHLHTVWMFTLMEEIIARHIPPGQIRQIITEYMKFETYGWRELMKK